VKKTNTRILWQGIWTRETPFFDAVPIWQGHIELFKRIARPDTTVEMRYPKRSTYFTSHSYLELLNNAEVVKGIIEGEKEGFDVAVIGCGNDPGLHEAREAVSIPVVGITESAMHLACLLGARFATIGTDRKSIPLVERNIKLYGLEGRAIARPARACEDYNTEIPRWFASVDYTRQYVVPAFERVAKQCIDDGAEVIVTACGAFAALTLAGYNKVTGTEVPVIENVAVGIKMAELLSDIRKTLGISTSKQLTYQSLPPEIRDEMAKPFFG